MRRQTRYMWIGVFLFVTAGITISGGAIPATSKDLCLKCHGPFEKLAVAEAKYRAPSGEKIIPHVYVPHNAKDAKAIPECSNCHQSHPVPPTADMRAAMPRPEVQWCYSTCHHENEFTPCKECHK